MIRWGRGDGRQNLEKWRGKRFQVALRETYIRVGRRGWHDQIDTSAFWFAIVAVLVG